MQIKISACPAICSSLMYFRKTFGFSRDTLCLSLFTHYSTITSLFSWGSESHIAWIEIIDNSKFFTSERTEQTWGTAVEIALKALNKVNNWLVKGWQYCGPSFDSMGEKVQIMSFFWPPWPPIFSLSELKYTDIMKKKIHFSDWKKPKPVKIYIISLYIWFKVHFVHI